MMQGSLRKLLVWIAGSALLAAVAVDALAMIGRQIRLPLIGSIEIVEAVILFAAGGALVIATLDDAHARVSLVLDRLPERWQALMRKLHALAAAVFFAAVLSGSFWIAADLWHGQEESELLHIPYRPLRLATIVVLAALLVLAVRSLLRRGTK